MELFTDEVELAKNIIFESWFGKNNLQLLRTTTSCCISFYLSLEVLRLKWNIKPTKKESKTFNDFCRQNSCVVLPVCGGV